MRVKIIRKTFVGGEAVEPPKPGKDGKPPKDDDGTITVSDANGRNLITAGKALPVDPAPDTAPHNRADDGAGASTK